VGDVNGDGLSVPMATVGLTPKRITSTGVISDPPPMPVIPTSVPMSSPVSVNCQVKAYVLR
jgi:hypothetical protein